MLLGGVGGFVFNVGKRRWIGKGKSLLRRGFLF